MAASVVALDATHAQALRAFLDRLPEGDLTFIKEDVRNPAIAEAWATERGPARRWVAVEEDGSVQAVAAVVPLVGWSAHVGDLRLVVDPAARGAGLGRALARHALREALEMGVQKIVVEVVSGQDGALAMFTDLGFRAEAVLACHIRDRSGELQDLVVLAHAVDDEWSTIGSLGVEDDLAAG